MTYFTFSERYGQQKHDTEADWGRAILRVIDDPRARWWIVR